MKKVNQNIAKIKEILPHGSLKEIALRSNTTIFTVSRVFNGKSNNQKVLSAIIDYAKEIKSVNTQLEQVATHEWP